MARAVLFFFFSSRRRHTRCSRDWSSDVCSSDLARGDDVLVWYTLWEDRASAARFFKGLGRAWARRRVGGPADRRFENRQLTVEGVPGGGLGEAPAEWAGLERLPAIRKTR